MEHDDKGVIHAIFKSTPNTLAESAFYGVGMEGLLPWESTREESSAELFSGYKGGSRTTVSSREGVEEPSGWPWAISTMYVRQCKSSKG